MTMAEGGDGTASPVAGSFRDPSNRVYQANGRILRGLDELSARHFSDLVQTPFYQLWEKKGWVVSTTIADDDMAQSICADGWFQVIEHEPVPVVTYPYEWTFSMLKEAAVRQLEMLLDAVEHDWLFKDSSAYNMQWVGNRLVFIDMPSLVPRTDDAPWLGYRQFCMMYLIPLLMKAHLGIDHVPLLRSNLDGVTPVEAAKSFRGLSRFKSGVMTHVLLQARLESHIAAKERDVAEAKDRKLQKQSKTALLGMLQGLLRLVQSLNAPVQHSDWSEYDDQNSYTDGELSEKEQFVLSCVQQVDPVLVWDLGCNTGRYSRLCAAQGARVLAVDGDHDAAEKLYLRAKADSAITNILPLVMNLSNPSPDQGWTGKERTAFVDRSKPNLVLCLAVIHHMCLASNVPIDQFLQWVRGLESPVVLEFVHREDDMVIKLLKNKDEEFASYNYQNFLSLIDQEFSIKARQPLKGGLREVFFLMPK